MLSITERDDMVIETVRPIWRPRTADVNAIKAAIDAGITFTLGSGTEIFEIGADHVTFTENLPSDISRHR
jgi:hypothetical protein